MTEQTNLADRNQADAPGNSAAGVAGLNPTDKPIDQQLQDRVPLSAGAVSNGGAYQGGTSPANAEDDIDEPMNPLDSREHFGGDGAHYVAADEPVRPPVQARGVLPGDIGYDEAAHPDVNLKAD